jgi:hypothetical protein
MFQTCILGCGQNSRYTALNGHQHFQGKWDVLVCGYRYSRTLNANHALALCYPLNCASWKNLVRPSLLVRLCSSRQWPHDGSSLQQQLCTHPPQLCSYALAPSSTNPLTAEARVRARVNPCGIYGGQSGTGTGFSPRSSVFPCQYRPIILPSLSKLISSGECIIC